jgi:hypothetical protein
MAYVEVKRGDDVGIGSAFHIGDGIFVTAKHVIDGWDISEVRIETPDYYRQSDFYHGSRDLIALGDAAPVLCDRNSGLVEVVEGPWFEVRDHVDIAAFRVNHVVPNGVYVPLGHQLDEWFSFSEFRLTRALVMGYPPIPFARIPELVAVSCEINSVVELPGLHFILSATARGGFSGGVAISEYGFALGIITQSLTMDYKPAELGFFATTSTEDIYQFLNAKGILPKCQLEGIEDIWPASKEDENENEERARLD